MRSRPLALLLDAGGTLLTEKTSRAAIYCEAARSFGLEVSEAQMARAMEAVHARMPLEVDGAFRYSEEWFRVFVAEVFARLRHPGPYEPIEDHLLAAFRDPGRFRLYEDVRPVLARLHGAGVPLAVVSNWSPPLPRLLAGLSIGRYFRAVLVSSVLRLEKPDPALFRRACGALGLEPGRCLHVGDRLREDVCGARRAGLEAVLLRRTEGAPASPAAGRVETWPSLLPALERFGLH